MLQSRRHSIHAPSDSLDLNSESPAAQTQANKQQICGARAAHLAVGCRWRLLHAASISTAGPLHRQSSSSSELQGQAATFTSTTSPRHFDKSVTIEMQYTPSSAAAAPAVEAMPLPCTSHSSMRDQTYGVGLDAGHMALRPYVNWPLSLTVGPPCHRPRLAPKWAPAQRLALRRTRRLRLLVVECGQHMDAAREQCMLCNAWSLVVSSHLPGGGCHGDLAAGRQQRRARLRAVTQHQHPPPRPFRAHHLRSHNVRCVRLRDGGR